MDLICFSHLRWNFVYQRPQHLLTRFAKKYRVFYIEEPEYINESKSYLASNYVDSIWVIVPRLHNALSVPDKILTLQGLIDQLFADKDVEDPFFWYYTPMALTFTRHLKPDFVVYDCMDELSAFKFAPPELKNLETELFEKADIVFTGGHSLYNAKKHLHHNIYPFPSSIDKEHFIKARTNPATPVDQSNIPHPRIGFYGVIDERFDIGLISEVAGKRPGWHFVIIGPVVKIDEGQLPRFANIHYLGSKSYAELPAYLSGWDIAIIPFLINDSTKYISPTKTPEYLAAGKPVISSSITDVINPYSTNNLVHIADNAVDFIKAVETELNNTGRKKWLKDVDKLLSNISWDITWLNMMELIENTMNGNKNLLTNLNEDIYV